MTQTASRIRDPDGTRIDRFVIRKRLGTGGMGEVFLADDSLLKRQVAIKAIKSEHSQDAGFRHRLLREAERASQLNNEHIAQIHDVIEHEGRLFLVMEYVEGKTLRARLHEPLGTEEFFSIAEQCLAGLAAAHQHDVLHCDLKPENLMITPDGVVKILDFGFARQLETQETRDSIDPSMFLLGGTLAYMAPEVLLGSPPDARSDIFSLGIVLYEAFTGQRPFRMGPATATVDDILQAKPAPISRDAPAGLNAVLGRMLASDPAQRYLTCADALDDIRSVHAGRTPRLAAAGWGTIRLPWRAIGSVTAIGVIGFLVLILQPVLHLRMPWSLAQVAASNRQLVVLPFAPGSQDASSRAFASGLTETLAAKLGQMSDRYSLDVAPTREIRQKVNDAEQARTMLGATMVLEGGLQQSGNTVRVTYSLVDTRSMRQVHSGVITADASNPFAVQDRVIEKVLIDLDIELAKEDQGRMQAHGTTQPQAYDFYLRGRGYLQEYDRSESLDNAIAAFQRSLEADPKFALAYAGLGKAYMHKYDRGHLPDLINQAKVECSTAAELDSNIADGEICLGMLFNTTGEYEQAAQHLQRAVKLDPSRDESYGDLARAYEGLGEPDRAEALFKTAIALRPQHWAGHKWLGRFYADRGRYDEAAEQFKRVVELAPDSYSGYSNLGAIYAEQGKYAEAALALEKSITIRPTAPGLNNLGALYFYQHKYLQAARSYEFAAQLTPNDYTMFGNLGEAYSQVEGKQEESHKNYNRALELAEQRLTVNAKDGKILSVAALYAAKLDQKAKAEAYRKAALKLSAKDPQVRLNSALVLSQLRQDSLALSELDRALHAGLPATEVINNPAWQRFAADPKYKTMIARAPSKVTN